MVAHPARPIAALLALIALASGLAACTHHGYRDGLAATQESAAGRLLGANPGTTFAPSAADLLHPGRMFYPLVVGDRWDYQVTMRIVGISGDAPLPPQVFQHALQSLVTGTQQIGERTYFLVQESDPGVAASGLLLPMREDRSGLYGLDPLAVATPAAGAATARATPAPGATALRGYVERTLASSPHRAAFERAADRLAARLEALRGMPALTSTGGPDPGELAYLRYPLMVGSHWIARDSPRFERTVVARERLSLPAGRFAAWRLRGTSELYGPDVRVAFWYSSAGLLRIRVHDEENAVDDQGNVVGRVQIDEDQVLTALRLFAPGSPTVLAVTPGEEDR